MPPWRDLVPSDPRPYQGEWADTVLCQWGHSGEGMHGAWWQQGTGKSPFSSYVATGLRDSRKIDAILVLAPNGVHHNWVDHELPKHLGVPYAAHAFDNGRHSGKVKRYQEELMDFLLRDEGKLKVLSVSHNALLKPSLVEHQRRGGYPTALSGLLVDFCRTRRVLIVGDELGALKNHEGKMSMSAQALSRLCPYRLGLDGTPVDNSPLDLYALGLYLDPRLWERRGFGTFVTFRNHFAIIKELDVPIYERNPDKTFRLDGAGNKIVKTRYDRQTGQRVPMKPPVITGYKNLEELREIVMGVSSRVTKKSAGLNLPPQTFVYNPFEMTSKQWAEYQRMKQECMVEIQGHLITAQIALAKITRLMQISSGYLPVDPEGRELVEIDPGHDPRLEATVGLAESMHEQGIIWAAWRPDRDKLVRALGDKLVCYRSDSSDDAKRQAIAQWRAGDYQFILGHVLSGLARGHTLVEGKFAIYHSNLFRYAPREQSQDRIHRFGQTDPVTYYDTIARRTMDQHAISKLVQKARVAAEVLGDDPPEWLSTDWAACLKDWLLNT